MKHAMGLFFVLALGLLAGHWAFGYRLTYSIAYGTIAAMGFVISGTFFWLWWRRTTPLALGMAFSWVGAASVMGWWWVYTLAGAPAAMAQNPLLFVFLGAYLVGAILHFQVMQGTMNLAKWAFWTPISILLGGVILAAVVNI